MDRNLEIAKLAHQQAQNGLSGQEASLDSIQQRASANIAIVGLAASLFAINISLPNDNPVFIGALILAGASFLVSVCTSLWLLVSRSGWVFHQSATIISEDYIENNPDIPLTEVYLDLAKYMEESFSSNDKKLKPMYRILKLGYACTALHIFAWVSAYILLS